MLSDRKSNGRLHWAPGRGRTRDSVTTSRGYPRAPDPATRPKGWSGGLSSGTDKNRQGPTGRIVNISSTGAKVAIPLLAAYSSSKSGLEGMSDALRRELMLFGIEVVIIEPGTVKTAMYDKGEKEDLSEFKQTEYWEAVQNFQKFIVAEARNHGLSPERLGEAVHVALSTAKPKALYAVVPQRFKN